LGQLFFVRETLYRVNCFYRAYIGAGTAIGTNFGVNFIDIAFGDSFYRALIDAASACSTIVVNYISHIVRV
jgi:hypothetical protein